MKKGLTTVNPSSREVAQLKKKLVLEKELDGIDAGNIIGSSRRD